ncbi:MAG TPA: hypothetical protein VI583_00920 [Cyclobacteriaceae bacterium]|nr:hypothetical protein [Cyclobacteriaceae bacterium]
MRYSTSAILCLFYSIGSPCQSVDFRMGGRAMSMGFANAAVSDEWSAYNNIGSLGAQELKQAAAVSYRSIYAIEGLGKIAAVTVWPLGKFSGTLNFFRFGDDRFNESRAGLGLGHKIGFACLGLQINFHQLMIENFGSRGIFYFDAGGLVELFKEFHVGAYIQNISQTRSSRISGEKFPVNMGLGVSYRPGDEVMLNVEVEKRHDGFTEARAGIEFSIRDRLFLRTGINLDPARNFFGLGIRPLRFKIDYALATQAHLGMSHEVTICYLIKVEE